MTFSRALVLLLLAHVAWAKPVVVSTTTVLHDIVREVGGDCVQPVSLLAIGADPHSYDPTPDDVRRLSKAALVLVNGLGFETWSEKLVAHSGYKGPVLVATEGVEPRGFDHDEIAVYHAEHAGHHHDVIDPHVWHDLRNVRRMAENVSQALCTLAPAEAETIRQRTKTYCAQIDALHAEALTVFGAIPAERRKLVTSHDALGYLGRAYGFKIVPIAGLSPEREPTARQLTRIVKFIRQQGVRAVFIESTSNPKIPQLIAAEAGVTVVHQLYTDSIGLPETEGATLLGMFRANMTVLTRALQ